MIQVCGKAFGRADLLKRHRANHDDDGNGTKRRRINSSPGAGRVAHACQACAKARVKCEESKPCTRCRNRNLTCEYASSEAGSAAAMHLLHLSANAHSSGATTPTSSAPMAPAGHGAVPTAHHLGSRSLRSNAAEAMHTHGLHNPAAPAMTNLVRAQATGTSPSILANNPPINSEAAQLPTPETMMDQSESSFSLLSVSYAGAFFFLARLLHLKVFASRLSVAPASTVPNAMMPSLISPMAFMPTVSCRPPSNTLPGQAVSFVT